MEINNMNINIDCMRKVLEFCIENIDYEEINSNEWQEKYVDLNMLYDSKKLKKYKHKDIIVGIKKCHFPSKIERTFKNAHLKVLFMSANKVHCNKMLISNKMFKCF